MSDAKRIEFTFPVGYQEFHPHHVFNFQLNRPYSFGYARLEDMKEAGQRITSFAEWKAEMLRQAEKAVSEGRIMNAAFYYRAAEFYTFEEDPDKEALYRRFTGLFEEAFKGEGIERFDVPYEGSFIPAMRVTPITGEIRGTILIHGGFDSLIEEFYSWMRFFADRGYEVIGFEGPGQGAARRKYGLALDYRWEKPTNAILNRFGLDDVTLLGISMGGYFCFRAAALETRIKRVIASSVAYDYMQFLPPWANALTRFFFTHLRGLSNWSAGMKMRIDQEHRWSISNLMYITKAKTPVEGIDVMMQLNAKNLLSHFVEQDVLILTGKEDHFIPLKMHHLQVKALTNARSVTERIFTREEQAHNHCQVGNTGLALGVMAEWIEKKQAERGS